MPLSKALLIALAAGFVLAGCVQPAAKQSSLCVARQEDNGFVNIVPVEVYVEGGARIRLLGGERSCAPVLSGRHNVSLTWTWDPRDPADQEHIATAPASIMIDRDRPTTMDVCLDKSGRYPSWAIRPAGACPTS